MRPIDADVLKKQFEDRSLEDFTHLHFIDAIDNAPTVNIQTAVMELYRRYQPRLATNVYEFGVELQELLGRNER